MESQNFDESSRLIDNDEEDWNRHHCFPRDSNLYGRYIRPLVAECLGTLILVFAGGLSRVSATLATIALCYGLTLIILIIVFGPISGGHVNPAVTLAVALTGNISVFMTILYCLAQLTGSIGGAALLLVILDNTTYVSINGATPVLGTDVSILRGLMMETLLTWILIIVILLTAVDKCLTYAPIAIGSILIVDILAGAPISGAAVNPAVAFGPAVIYSTKDMSQWEDQWIYWVGEILGSVLAATSFRYILASPEKRRVSHDKDDIFDVLK